jgi:hypothetical protein
MQVHFTLEEILDAITNPRLPLVAYEASLLALRSKLSQHISACCTDEDLLWAARHTAEPLLASKACKIQVLANKSGPSERLSRLNSAELSRRIEVDLNSNLQTQPAQPITEYAPELTPS